MRLLEAIVDANHRAVAGDASAGLHPEDYADELPIIALTCIDPRLNPLFPNVLGLPSDQFIWLRNAGNIITGPLSSTMRSLALACAVKEGREIAVIGHTDCRVCQTSAMQLLDQLQRLGVDRHRLPENLTEFFGLFATERQNVIKACGYVRESPLIGPKIPVHGLLVDINTGRLEWVVNGYQVWGAAAQPEALDFRKTAGTAIGALGSPAPFDLGEMKFPEMKIGDAAGQRDLGEIKPMVSAPVPTSPPVGTPPTIPPVSAQPPPPPPRMQPVRSAAPAVTTKKTLPPPIRPRIVKRDHQW
jgi:carbonic anhydrase